MTTASRRAFSSHNGPRRYLWTRRGLMGVLLLLVLAAPAFGKPDKSPKLVELAPLVGDTDSFATDINNRGKVSGRSVGARTTAVRWDRKGKVTALLPHGDDLHSFGEAINNRDEVVGISRSGEDPCVVPGVVEIYKDTAVVWDRHGRTRVLMPIAGDVETRGYGINNKGVAVGISLGPRRPDCTASFTGVMWDKHGNPTPLASPSAVLDETFGYDINSKGVVAGFNNTFDGSAFNATVWDKHGVPTNLPTITGANFELANGLNNKGEVVGTDFVAFAAHLWDKKGNMTVLPGLDASPFSSAVDINNRGKVVGSSFDPVSFAETAVIWDKHGVPTALPPLPGDAGSSGLGINDPGHVAGHSTGATGTTAVVWR